MDPAVGSPQAHFRAFAVTAAWTLLRSSGLRRRTVAARGHFIGILWPREGSMATWFSVHEEYEKTLGL